MKNLIAITLLILLAAGTAAAEPAAKAAPAAANKAAADSRYKGAVFEALRNLSAMLPKQNNRNADPRQSATMGIRGSETTASLINPYWKDDKADDPAFQAEVHDYSAAQQLLEDGHLKEAETAFSTFIQTHPSSDLLPNARFGLGLACAAQGDKKRGSEAMTAFARDYPQHPLAVDAQKVAAELK